MSITEKMHKDAKLVRACNKRKRVSFSWKKEMVVGLDARLTNKKTTTPHEFISLAVNPNVEVLLNTFGRNSDVHALNYPPAFRGREKQRS